MQLIRVHVPLVWGTLDVPLFGLSRDWHGQSIGPRAAWCLLADPERLWFIVTRSKPASVHPQASPGTFQAELWKHDVAELFIASPRRNRYLEINLSPNGAWWTSLFDRPRQPAGGQPSPWPGVETHVENGNGSQWVVALSLPLAGLRDSLGFGDQSPMNVAFIVDSPDQRFLTAGDLGGGDPDFHRPDRFPIPRWVDVGLPD
jgi:hypothetical protein